jgi:hypothetical protein
VAVLLVFPYPSISSDNWALDGIVFRNTFFGYTKPMSNATEASPIRGQVTRRTINKGLSSERKGIMIQTENGEYQLRRKGINPSDDPILDGLVGENIQAAGDFHRSLPFIFLESWQTLETKASA